MFLRAQLFVVHRGYPYLNVEWVLKSFDGTHQAHYESPEYDFLQYFATERSSSSDFSIDRTYFYASYCPVAPTDPLHQTPDEMTVSSLQARWLEYQRRHQLKHTRQRDLIVDEFFHSRLHISVEELLHVVRQKNAHIGYVTVYRTLKLLVDAQLAEARQFGDGQTRYEAVSPDHHHHDHLICTKCGLILEFENSHIEKLQERMARELGNFTISHHKLELYGLCPKARGERNGRCPQEQRLAADAEPARNSELNTRQS